MSFTVQQRANHIQIWQKTQVCSANYWAMQLSQKRTRMKSWLSNRRFILLKRHLYVTESWSTEATEGINRTCRMTSPSQGRHHRYSDRTKLQDIQHRCPRRLRGKDRHRRPRRPVRRDTHCSLRWRKISQSGQNLKLLLLSNIHMATNNGLSTKWGRAYHGNATEHREQSEVEGTHDSMAVCRIVRRLSAKGEMKCLREVEKRELGRCED